MNHAKRMILVPENTLERLQQRQQILTPPVTQTLKNLDNEMSDILSSKELDDEAKAKLYNQVLQRYLTYYDQRKGQPLHVKLTTPKPVETPKPEESKQSTEEPAPEKSVSTAVEEEVMKSVPKIYKNGVRQLLDKMKENRDVQYCAKVMQTKFVEIRPLFSRLFYEKSSNFRNMFRRVLSEKITIFLENSRE